MMPGGLWRSDCTIHTAEHLERAKYYDPKNTFDHQPGELWKGTVEAIAWHLAYSNWAFYNANYECGYYAHYYAL